MIRTRLFIFALLLAASAYAQDVILPLWSEGVPQKIDQTELIEKVEMQKGIIRRISKVTDPDISIYLPEGGTASKTAIVICPGGGYSFLSYTHEGIQVAKWLNTLGVAGIVLKSRLPEEKMFKNSSQVPLDDVLKAIRMVRTHADDWNIERVGILGFSAGGHLAASASTHYRDSVERPDFSVLIYPVISMDASFTHMGSRRALIGGRPATEDVKYFSNELQVTPDTPPAFLVHSADDRVVPVANSQKYLEALKANAVGKSEMHIFPNGNHGYGMAAGKKGNVALWPRLCEGWLRQNGWIR